MPALVVDDDHRDADRLRSILFAEGLDAEICASGKEAEASLTRAAQGFQVALVLWEIGGPPFGFELVRRCRALWPTMPVVVMSGTLDASLAARAFAFGARDFLAKPLDGARVKACIRDLLSDIDPLLAFIDLLREERLTDKGERLLGAAPAFVATLRQVAKVMGHDETRVLLLGESGTGKELLARAIHHFGPQRTKPWVAVNIGETPSTLIESALFGHERGAFTDAKEARKGFLELASDGTLFLDEIGDLDLQLQGKLLRLVQQREFRRLGGTATLPFRARLICATNRELAEDVNRGRFRRDLFHRIAEVTVHVPPLRERPGDIPLLVTHFLELHKGNRPLQLTREAKVILQSYPFPGNVRELENVVKNAVIECEGDAILPRHLPLPNMGKFLSNDFQNRGGDIAKGRSDLESIPLELSAELQGSVPENWLDLPYRAAVACIEKAFDRAYLKHKLARFKHNVTRAAASAALDTKTFRKRWKESGMAPLDNGKEDA
ncbi:MAG TPA: sigma-54 dependent transcriptional regulator [Vicinamibacterales bacterium]|nr:sigma-54 dependent transcriptional regulator [Vicinamibacterales bacterium]